MGHDRLLGRAPRFTPGHASVVFGRFVIGARVLLAPLAGLTRMPFHRFVAFDALGCFVWAGLFIVIGYASGMKLETMQVGLQMVSTTAQGAIVVALGAWAFTRVVAMRRARV